ncbi:unnamed protein product, partial [Didymodactylos carnosus]
LAINYCTKFIHLFENDNNPKQNLEDNRTLISDIYEICGNIYSHCNEKIIAYNCYRKSLSCLEKPFLICHKDIKRIKKSIFNMYHSKRAV